MMVANIVVIFSFVLGNATLEGSITDDGPHSWLLKLTRPLIQPPTLAHTPGMFLSNQLLVLTFLTIYIFNFQQSPRDI